MNIIKAKKFIRVCYEIIINRTPKESEINYWSKKIVNEKMDELDVIYSFVSSKEFLKSRDGKDGKE